MMQRLQRGPTASTLKRRDVLRGAGAIALAGWSTPGVRGQTALRIALPETLFADSATLLNAKLGNHLGGALAAAEIELVADSQAAIAGLREGRFAFAEIQALDLMRVATQPGETLVSIATHSRIPLSVFGRRGRLPAEAKHFRGAKIAISGEVVDADAYLSLYLARNGVDPGRIRRLPKNREVEALDLVLSGKVDGAVMSPGFMSFIRAAQKQRGTDDERMGTRAYWIDTMRNPFPGPCIVAAIGASPELAAELVRALLLSARELLAMWDAHVARDDGGSALVERLKRAPAPTRSELRTFLWAGALALAGLWRATGDRARPLWHDPKRWNDAAALVSKAGIADIGGTADRLYTNRFVEGASQ